MLIIPKTLAMELSRITIRQTGARYFMKKLYNFFLPNLDDCSISFAILSNPITLITRKHVASAASGIMTEFVMKSKKSRKFIPKILIKSSRPYPIEDALPKTIITMAISKQDLLRLQCNSSSKVETALSVSAMELVTAANSTNKKKTIPIAVPNPMFAKTFGIVINIKAGPDFNVAALPPEKAKTAGMIISPAMIAIAVSKISTFSVDFSMEVSFFI